MENSITDIELKVLEAIAQSAVANCGNPGEDLMGAYAELGDYETFADLDSIKGLASLSTTKTKSTLASLIKRSLIYIAKAEEYSLGCDCWYLIDAGIELLKAMHSNKEIEPIQEVLEIMEDVKAEMVEEGQFESIVETNKENSMEILKEKQTKGLKVDPRNITFENENNPRKEYGDMKSLERFIKENGAGKLPAIKVRKSSEGLYELIHGYRRMNAISSLIKKGEHPGLVKVEIVLKSYSSKDELLDHLTDNEGQNLTPFEQAFVYKNLEEAGMTQKEIRERTGKSRNHITWMIKLAEAPKEIHDAIISGKVSTSLATDFLYRFKDEAEAKLLEAIKLTEEIGQKKVTKKVADKVAKAAGKVVEHKFTKRLNSVSVFYEETHPFRAKLDRVKAIVEALELDNAEEMMDQLDSLL